MKIFPTLRRACVLALIGCTTLNASLAHAADSTRMDDAAAAISDFKAWFDSNSKGVFGASWQMKEFADYWAAFVPRRDDDGRPTTGDALDRLLRDWHRLFHLTGLEVAKCQIVPGRNTFRRQLHQIHTADAR